MYDAADLPTVHAFQDKLSLVPLSQWGKENQALRDIPVEDGADPSVPPIGQVEALNAEAFFNELALLMGSNPAAAYDAPMLEKLRLMDLVPGSPYQLNDLPMAQAVAVREGYAAGRMQLAVLGEYAGGEPVNGWIVKTEGIGRYDDNYNARAVTAVVGLGVNLPEDAVYSRSNVDGDGQRLNTKHQYRLTFAAGQWPPAQAFWSLTMYDDNQALVENSIERYAIGSRDQLVPNPDGSLTLYLQSDPPAGSAYNNWLPAPQAAAQDFNVIMRLYWPRPQVLSGDWQVPAIERVGD